MLIVNTCLVERHGHKTCSRPGFILGLRFAQPGLRAAMILISFRQLVLDLAVSSFLAATMNANAVCNIVGNKAYGNCAGVQITNQGGKGHLTVKTYTSEQAVIQGATILKGGTLVLRGVSNGDITVHQGGRLEIKGLVNGTVKNLGGNVKVDGMLSHLFTSSGQVTIAGNVGSISGNGAVTYLKGSIINGVPFEETVHKGLQ